MPTSSRPRNAARVDRTTALCLPAALVLLALTLAVGPALAYPFDGHPKILLHLTGATTKSQCQSGGLRDCAQASTVGQVAGASGPWYFAYLLAARGSTRNLAGVTCGLHYQEDRPENMSDRSGIDIFSWHLCADAEFRTSGPSAWPAPAGGNTIAWNSLSRCQAGEVAVAGYFYLAAYSHDQLQITRHPYSQVAAVATCESIETDLNGSDLGFVTFVPGGTGTGCNPCLAPCPDPPTPVPVIPPPPGPPWPASSQPPKLLLHVGPAVRPNSCGRLVLESPEDVSTRGGLSAAGGPFYNVYLIASRGTLPTIGGLECGITYENGRPGDKRNGAGIDILEWTLCASAQIPNGQAPAWPAPGSGNIIAWDVSNNCQVDSKAVAGYFYLAAYSADALYLTPSPGQSEAHMLACDPMSVPMTAADLGYVRFSSDTSVKGCNPVLEACAVVPVRVATWGGIKALFLD